MIKSTKKKIVRIVSDFNAGALSGFLKNKLEYRKFEIEVSPYGQLYKSLARSSDSWVDIVWTTPERILPGFKKAYQLEEITHEDVVADVNDFADSIVMASKNRYVFVASWVLPTNIGYGMLDWKDGLGLSNLLAKCNLRLAEKISASSNIFMLPTHIWMQETISPFSNKMWYAAKIPYIASVFEHAAKHIVQYIDGINGRSRRLIVLDLDNTLWGGVVGENGWQGIRLGGHDHVGEAFKDFQSALKSLTNRGVQLAIASKNDETVAMEAIDNHPEMILKRSDFAGWRINWHDKANNILDLANEINLGLDSIVFIDDNPAERSRVSDAVQGVLVPDWPKDPAMYVEALHSLSCFETPVISKEDRGRTMMYVSERNRNNTKHSVKNIDDWLKKLGTQVTASYVNSNSISRVTQLFNKTNQLNLSTRRLSEQEIITWAAHKSHSMMAISVSDQFGDMGLVGIISVEAIGDRGRLIDFILSCRVMGRQVEETLVHLAVSELVNLGAKVMEIVYLPTDRNGPTLEILENSKLEKINLHEFRVDVDLGYEKPALVKLNFKE